MGIHDGHRERVRDRFLNEGLDRFEAHNVLEMILFYAVPRQDTNELAHELMNKFKTFAGVLDAPIEKLCEVEGIGKNSATLIKMFLPVARYYQLSLRENTRILDSTTKCGEYLSGLFAGLKDERVLLVCLDSCGRLLDCPVISEGDISRSEVSVRKVIEEVIRTGATGVVMAHNHPGGTALPSDADVQATLQIKDTLRHVGVRLLDHIIIAGEDYISFAQSKKYSYIVIEKQ